MRLAFLAVICGAGWAAAGNSALPAPDRPPTPIPELAKRYCLDCHGGENAEGGFDLTASITGEQWEEAYALVDREEMPEREPVPTTGERVALLQWIRSRAETSASEREIDRPRFFRLTNEEYSHSVRDLTGLDLRPGDWLPPDAPGETGFFNDRRSLTWTPSRFERYVMAAERVADAVEMLRSGDTVRHIWEAEELERSSSHLKEFDEGVLFSVEAQMISTSVLIPVDGYYEVRLRGATMGLPSTVQILDGTEIVATRVIREQRPETHTITVPVLFQRGWRNLSLNSQNQVPQARLPRDADRVFNEAAERNRMRVPEVATDRSGETAAARKRLEEISFYLQQAFEWLYAYGTEGDPRDIVRFRQYAEERLRLTAEAREEFRNQLDAGEAKRFDAEWERLNAGKWADYQEHMERISGIKWMDWTKYQGQLYLDSIEIVGPILPGGGTVPSTWERAPRELAGELLPRAFRREVGTDAVSRFTGQDRRETWIRILSAPGFLFKDGASPATMLSYYLWKSMPDEELRRLDSLLREGDEAKVREIVRGMMRDPRSEDGARSFVQQWLGIESLGRTFQPDPYRFPSFRLPVLRAAREEPVRFWRQLVETGASPMALLDSEFTMTNGELARFYEWEAGSGADWRRVELASSSPRGGVLGMSAVLASTSTAVRTSPVVRGKWVWETLLGRDAGEPLPDAGILPATAGAQSGLTLREEMERHRKDPRCSRCHRKLDPIGLALENFDGIGQWRDEMAGKPIDVQGTFYGGGEFQGPEGLKRELQARGDEFVAELAERLAEFGAATEVPRIDPMDLGREWVRESRSLASLVEEVGVRLVELSREDAKR